MRTDSSYVKSESQNEDYHKMISDKISLSSNKPTALVAEHALQKYLYLCDGVVENCPKTNCYKLGYECRHTTDKAHALNPEPHRFLPDLQGNLWEKPTERAESWLKAHLQDQVAFSPNENPGVYNN